MTEFVSIASLWLPIVVAAVLVFVASSIVWMVLPHHKNDFLKMAGEEDVMKAMRDAGVQPGQYSFPNYGGDMTAMKDPAYVEKMNQGPVGMLLVGPNGPPAMGKALGQWFVYLLMVGVFVAYLTGRVAPAGAEYMTVFRISGTTAFLGFNVALASNGIWKGMSWSMIFKEWIDGFVYSLLTAGAFAGFWPDAA